MFPVLISLPYPCLDMSCPTIVEDRTSYSLPNIISITRFTYTRFTYPSVSAVDRSRSTTALLSSAVPANKGNIGIMIA